MYAGIERSFTLRDLDADHDYVLRVAACNVKGMGAWSRPLKVTTLREPPPEERDGEDPLPESWVALRMHCLDLLDDRLSGAYATTPSPDQEEAHWAAVVDAMRAHYRCLKTTVRGREGFDPRRDETRALACCCVRPPLHWVGFAVARSVPG